MALRLLFTFLFLSTAVSMYGMEKLFPFEMKAAIVAENGNAEMVADAVMVKLSARGVVCLERTAIKKVLDEQKLSAGGLIDPGKIVSCCQMLKVDVFAVIVCSPKTQIPVGVIVFDTRFGLRLADIALPEKFEDQVKLTADTVMNAITKKQQLNDSKLKFISFLPLSLIALKGREADSARLAELVLMRIMGQNQNVQLLERRQLDFLLKERTLLRSDSDNQLSAGSLFIQLEAELSGDKAKPLALKLFIKDISGKIHFSLRESYVLDDEVKVAGRLAEETGRKLGTTVVSGNFDRKAEAVKYMSESIIAQINGMYERASQLARNAYVLSPDFREQLVQLEAEIAQGYLPRGSVPRPEDVEAAVVHAEFLLAMAEHGKYHLGAMTALSGIGDYYYDNHSLPQLKKRVIALRKETEVLMLEYYNQLYKPVISVSSAKDMTDIVNWFGRINHVAEICRNNEVNNKYGLPLAELYIDNIDRFYIPDTVSRIYPNSNLFELDTKPDIALRLRRLYCAMQSSSYPYYKILGTFYLLELNKDAALNDSSYTDFVIKVFESDPTHGHDWIYLLNDSFFSRITEKSGLKLCRSFYKINGFQSQLFSEFCNRIFTENTAVEFYSFISEIQDSARNDKNMTITARNEIIKSVEKCINILKQRFPNLKELRNVESQQLLIPWREPQTGFKRIFNLLPTGMILSQPLYNGKDIYVVRMEGKDRLLYRISPSHDFSNQAGEKLCIESENIHYHDKYLACLSKEYYIMGTSAGMFLFPLNLSSPKYVPMKEFSGLNCYAITCMNEKVYMSFSESCNGQQRPVFIVEYDLQGKSYSVIYSSIQTANNPFVMLGAHSAGNSPFCYKLFQFGQLYADAVRNRLIVPVLRIFSADGIIYCNNPPAVELWAFNLTSHDWGKLADIPYFSFGDVSYLPFITAKSKSTLIIMGHNIVYEFDTVSNQLKVIFFSDSYDSLKKFPSPDNSARMKDYKKWKPLQPGWLSSYIAPAMLDGNMLWTPYRVIFLEQKKALKLISKQGNNCFLYAYFVLKDGNFVIGSNHNCIPNDSLMVMELKSDSELLKLPECEDIAP